MFVPGRAHDERHAHLSEPRVGDADHRDLRDDVEAEEQVLDLRRGHVEAATDVDVLLPVGDPQRAVVVEHADVAGVQPAVGVDRTSGCFGVVVVAAHHVEPAYEDLVVVGDGDLDAIERVAAVPVRHVLRLAVGPRDRHHRGALGEPVAGGERLEGELGADAAQQLGRHR